MDEKDQIIQKTKEYNYVLWAIILVLSIMVIDLFAQETCNDEDFVKQVSFASTLSSIILSVIAIIMTVISNDTVGSLLHRVRDLHDNIKGTPAELQKTSNELLSSISKLSSLEEKFNKMPEEIKQAQIPIEKNIELLKVMLDKAIEKIDGIDKKTDKFNLQVDDIKYKGLILSDDFVESFLGNLHEASLLPIYLCIDAYKKNVNFRIKDVTDRLFNKTHHNEYFTAVINVVRALGLIELSVSEDNLIKVTKVNPKMEKVVVDNIKMEIAKKLMKDIENYLESINL